MPIIKPFANEEETDAIGDLTIENRMDRVSLYGGLEITKDREGLRRAEQLKELIEAIVQTLQAEPALPEKVQVAIKTKVQNPFS